MADIDYTLPISPGKRKLGRIRRGTPWRRKAMIGANSKKLIAIGKAFMR